MVRAAMKTSSRRTRWATNSATLSLTIGTYGALIVVMISANSCSWKIERQGAATVATAPVLTWLGNDLFLHRGERAVLAEAVVASLRLKENARTLQIVQRCNACMRRGCQPLHAAGKIGV